MSMHTPAPWFVTDSGVRDRGGYIAHTNPVQRYAGQDERYAFEVAQREDDKRLIAAAPKLLSAQTMGATMDTPEFLDWLADRLVHVYGEKPGADFVLSLRERASAGRAAIAKAEGRP